MKVIRKGAKMTSHSSESKESIYISANEILERWRCKRSSVYRTARREGFTRICLGNGKNGMVRYLREEVIAYEESRRIQMQP